MTSGSYSTCYTYDALGRLVRSVQTTPGGPGSPYAFSYGYSLNDDLTSITYPSGRQVVYNLDSVGRLASVRNGPTGSYYVSSITTKPHGGIGEMTMGNGTTQAVGWNDRLQPTQIQTKAANQTSLLTLGFAYCTGGAATCSPGTSGSNNGSLRTQSIAGPGLNLTQTYTYDPLNRLTGATEGGNALESYDYTGVGNRFLTQRSLSLPDLINSYEVPTAANWYTSSNRINGWTYDANGNIRQVGSTVRNFTYDAEDRQKTATMNGNTATYAYDGDGLRVSKTVGGQTTVFVYDAFGNLAAEYGTPTGSPCGTTTCYLTTDHLGSTRLLTDSVGSSTNVQRYDFLPFGEEIRAGVNGRSTSMGYPSTPDAFLEKFTGHARDTETANVNTMTGLDWMRARQYSSGQGRFQSVDPANAGASVGDPQSWNGYSYVGNNPLNYTDPDGMDPTGMSAFCGFGGVWGCVAGAAVHLCRIFCGDLFGGQQSPAAPKVMAGGGIGNSPEVWSEKVPISHGGVNTGSVYGGGSAGGMVFNLIEVDQRTQYTRFYTEAIAYLFRDPGMRAIWAKLDGSPRRYRVTMDPTKETSSVVRSARGGATIIWNPTASHKLTGGGCISPALALGHEFAHAFDLETNATEYLRRANSRIPGFGNEEERFVILGAERTAARTLGEPLRNDHANNGSSTMASATSRCR